MWLQWTYFINGKHQETSPRVADAVEKRIIGEIEALPPYLDRIRASDRVPGTRELVVNKLPYILFVQVRDDTLVILNIVHTRKNFPA